VQVLQIIFEQRVTSEFLAAKIYRFLVRDELSADLRARLGAILRVSNFEIKPLLTAMLTSKDFYSQASYGGHIKGPVEHYVSMMNHLGAGEDPRHPRLQSVDDRDGPEPAQSAVGGGLGGRQGVDHAGVADRARQRGARRARPRHDRLP
jgi:uncharacterized protein (DUF1800 family)